MTLFGRKREKRHGLLLQEGVDGGNRCRECDAACCRGFPSVELTPGEYATLERLGAGRLQYLLNGRHYLMIENGCEFLVGNRCGIYEQRPAICRRFTCRDP
jgi:Fe-S-cluster containining protein